MRQLAGEGLPINLAISLHAPNEPLRKAVDPLGRAFRVAGHPRRRPFLLRQDRPRGDARVHLLSGVNDRPEHAAELAKLCKTLRANVNLIRYNEVAGLPFIRPKSDDVVRFQSILRNNGVNAHVRKSRGRDIDAACGQLRRKQQEQSPSATPPAPLVQIGG
jgi:23S rRNA (adenine2503-C2)-methyltransferase